MCFEPSMIVALALVVLVQTNTHVEGRASAAFCSLNHFSRPFGVVRHADQTFPTCYCCCGGWGCRHHVGSFLRGPVCLISTLVIMGR